MAGEYQTVYADWKRAPEAFWRTAAGAIDWYRIGEAVFDADADVYGRWFPGWETNTCHNCIDRHVEAGNGDRTAIIYDSPVTGTKRRITYREAQGEIATLAAVLRAEGVEKGDRVIIYMPMIPEAVFAMLAVARLGAIHSVVFGGFAAQELATRIDDCGARIVISASCGIEPGRVVAYKPLLDHAIELCAHPPQTCLIFQRPQLAAEMVDGRDIDLASAVAAAKARRETAACVAVAATDPAYILYTSGTTGQPKGVVRDTGGHMVALAWSMRAIYGMEAGEVFWSASDIGWVVGHSYIVYGPLLAGCTTVIFEGKPVGTPDAGTFWRVIQEHDVKVLFTAPTALRAIRRDDPEGAHVARYDLSQFRGLYLAGERADPETIKWAERLLHVPVIDHWWQTETGWAIAANPAGIERLPIKHGSPTVPMPGYEVTVLDDEGHAVAPGTLGNIVVRLPLPPGCLVTFWNADARFRTACLEEFPGYYKTADAGTIDEDGYLFIMARTDDIINCAGHRLSTGGMEEVVARHPAVAECAVIGIHDTLKGQVPCGFLVLKAGVTQDLSVIRREVIELVREEIGPVAAFKSALVVERLPKTRSGKILRGTMQKIADGLPWKMPATIDDPAILDEITAVLHAEEAHHK